MLSAYINFIIHTIKFYKVFACHCLHADKKKNYKKINLYDINKYFFKLIKNYLCK